MTNQRDGLRFYEGLGRGLLYAVLFWSLIGTIALSMCGCTSYKAFYGVDSLSELISDMNQYRCDGLGCVKDPCCINCGRTR